MTKTVKSIKLRKNERSNENKNLIEYCAYS